MAMNRIFLGCKKCGKLLFMSKIFHDGWYASHDIDVLQFFTEHDKCINYYQKKGEEIFEIVYESNDTMNYKDDGEGDIEPFYIPS